MRSANHALRPLSEEYAFFAQAASTAFVCRDLLNDSMGSVMFSAPAMPSSSSRASADYFQQNVHTIRLL